MYTLHTEHQMHGVEARSLRRSAGCDSTCTASRREALVHLGYQTKHPRRLGEKRAQMCRMCCDMHGAKGRSMFISWISNRTCTASRREAFVSVLEIFRRARRRGQKRLCMLDMEHDMHGVEARSVRGCERCLVICTASRREASKYARAEPGPARTLRGSATDLPGLGPDSL